jgi:hypothetical protein
LVALALALEKQCTRRAQVHSTLQQAALYSRHLVLGAPFVLKQRQCGWRCGRVEGGRILGQGRRAVGWLGRALQQTGPNNNGNVNVSWHSPVKSALQRAMGVKRVRCLADYRLGLGDLSARGCLASIHDALRSNIHRYCTSSASRKVHHSVNGCDADRMLDAGQETCRPGRRALFMNTCVVVAQARWPLVPTARYGLSLNASLIG